MSKNTGNKELVNKEFVGQLALLAVQAENPISKELIEKMTLFVFQTGADHINHSIMLMLPTNMDAVIKETGLTKVPVNNRVNALERAGLLKRWRGTKLLEPTELGKLFINEKDIFKEKHIRGAVMSAILQEHFS